MKNQNGGLPRPCLYPGRYCVVVRKGILSLSTYAGIFEFRCVTSGDLLAFYAEAPVWHAIVPNPYSERLAAATGACQFDMPVFSIGGVPLLRTFHKLRSGLVAPSHVPVRFLRESHRARQREQAVASARVS